MKLSSLKMYLRHPTRLLVRIGKNSFLKRMSDEKYLKMLFKDSMGYPLDLENPKTFNEKLQWLKLYDRKPIYTTMVDKYEAKKYVADIIGEEYIIPPLGVWDSFDDIDFDKLPEQFVLKCTHDSGGLVICRDKSKLDMEHARKKIERCLKRNYYWSSREWAYKNVKPRILAEQYLEGFCPKNELDEENPISCDSLQSRYGLLDYKFMCFNGKVGVLFLDIGVIGKGEGHAVNYYRNVYDRDGNVMPFKETREHYPIPVSLPDNFKEMVDVAEKLSEGIACLRVDLYRLSNGDIKVGELTFFHGGGLSNVFDPPIWDKTLGDWIELPEKS